jgi:bacterioferritin-associated ferredoxin
MKVIRISIWNRSLTPAHPQASLSTVWSSRAALQFPDTVRVGLRMRSIRIYTPLHLLLSRLPEPAMIVCVCRRVSDREIARHARAGMSFDDIQFELGVATQCGQCEGCARDIVGQCSPTAPVAALRPTESVVAWAGSPSRA